MIATPIGAWILFTRAGYIPLKLFALLVMLGLWGIARVIKGITMVLAPKSEAGDVSAQ